MRDAIDILSLVRSVRDPYNYNRVAAMDHKLCANGEPGLDDMGVDYRTDASGSQLTHGFPIVKLIAIPATALLLTVALRVLSPWTTSFFSLGIALIYMLIVALLWVSRRYITETAQRPLAGMLHIAMVPVVVWCLLRLSLLLATPWLSYLVPFFLALGACALVANDVATHYAAWSMADPRADSTTRRRWQIAWSRRWKNAAASPEASAALQPVLRRYALRFIYLAVPYTVAMLCLQFVADDAFGHLIAGSLALLVFCGLLLAVAPNPRLNRLSTVFRALRSYVTYSPQRRIAPGVLKSPAGPCQWRYSKFAVALAAMTFATGPMSLYFPIGLIASGPQPWHVAAERTEVYIEAPLGLSREVEPDIPSRSEVLAGLTAAERSYLNALPSDSAREAYIDSKRGPDRHQQIATVSEFITGTPESWLLVAFVGFSTAEALFAWSLIASLLLSLAVPICVFLLVVYALAGEAVVVFDRAFNGPTPTAAQPNDQPLWRGYAERLHESPVRLAREHLWIGTSTYNDYPVLLHRSALHEHAHILGDTGSGKTSRGLAPLVSQLIATGAPRDGYPGHSVVVIDLKGEPYFFNSTRVESRAAGLPYRWFTNVNGRSTYAFNPFLQEYARGLSPQQLAEVLLQSLGLEYGEAYGPSHYSRMNRRVMQHAMHVHSQAGKGEITSFRQLEGILQQDLSDLKSDERKDATDVFAVIESLARLDSINITQEDVDAGRVAQRALDASIDMGTFLETPQVGYFYFSSTLETSTVRELSKLVLFSLLTAADTLERQHGPGHRVYVVIDEFQQIIANNLELVLRQARSKNISCILANQSISDLKSGAIDVISTVQANTRVRQYFAASDINQQQLIERSGGDLHLHGIFEPHPLEELSVELGVIPAPDEELVIAGQISRDEVIAMTDDPDACILHVTRGSGLTQFSGYPLLMKTDYHVSERRFNHWKAKRWPKQCEETIVVPLEGTAEIGDDVLVVSPDPELEKARQARKRKYNRGNT